MKKTDIAQAVDALKAYQPTSGYQAFCHLDDEGFDIDKVYKPARAKYEKDIGRELPVATYIFTAKPDPDDD